MVAVLAAALACSVAEERSGDGYQGVSSAGKADGSQDRCWAVGDGRLACACAGEAYFIMGQTRTCGDCQDHCSSDDDDDDDDEGEGEGDSAADDGNQPSGTVLEILDGAQEPGSDHFDPPVVVVQPGAEIMVSNEDVAIHTVTSGFDATPDGNFDTELVFPGESKSIRAPHEPGEYTYFCALHSWIEGTIYVK